LKLVNLILDLAELWGEEKLWAALKSFSLLLPQQEFFRAQLNNMEYARHTAKYIRTLKTLLQTPHSFQPLLGATFQTLGGLIEQPLPLKLIAGKIDIFPELTFLLGDIVGNSRMNASYAIQLMVEGSSKNKDVWPSMCSISRKYGLVSRLCESVFAQGGPVLRHTSPPESLSPVSSQEKSKKIQVISNCLEALHVLIKNDPTSLAEFTSSNISFSRRLVKNKDLLRDIAQEEECGQFACLLLQSCLQSQSFRESAHRDLPEVVSAFFALMNSPETLSILPALIPLAEDMLKYPSFSKDAVAVGIGTQLFEILRRRSELKMKPAVGEQLINLGKSLSKLKHPT